MSLTERGFAFSSYPVGHIKVNRSTLFGAISQYAQRTAIFIPHGRVFRMTMMMVLILEVAGIFFFRYPNIAKLYTTHMVANGIDGISHWIGRRLAEVLVLIGNSSRCR